MRNREEQRRKFHEALINMLYPPPSPPPAPSTIEQEINVADDDGLANVITLQKENSDHEVDEGKSSSDGGDEKLSRAQRKRLRKRKLKEDSARCGKMIGPLLPIASEKDASEGARRNVSVSFVHEDTGSNIIEVGDGVGSGKNKVKQRRKARRLAQTLPESAEAEKLIGDSGGHSFS